MTTPPGIARVSVSTVGSRIAFVVAALAAPCGAAFAQSTATRIEEGTLTEVVVSATRVQGTGLIQAETAPKARTTVSDEYIETQMAGQSVINSLNLVPGVNFTNSDPYGSSGGNLRMRSFDGNRISLMLDGIQLNDTGNYAMYTNQQLDPEIIERVAVNMGTTDVDSPTASATGGTINIISVRPKHDPGMAAQASFGSDSYQRYYLRGDTGAFGPWDTEALLAVSYQQYDKFKGPGELEKTQINGRIYQDLGDGDFISLAFHGNKNRNNFYRNLSKAEIAANGYDFDNDPTCTRPAPGAGAQNEATSATGTTSLCTNYYNVRSNPSDTANIRMQSSFGLTDSLTLTVDPSFQYTLANGGGITVFAENDRRLIGTATGGTDLNGDGDLLDRVSLFTPNNTNTRRYSLNSSLIWELNDTNMLRLGYTLDYGKHRQTGQHGPLQADGDPENVFAGRQGQAIPTADGSQLRGRDRYTVAELNQVSLSYSGRLMDEKLRLSLGLRAPFFERELNQYCFTQVSNGTQYCTTQVPNAANAQGYVTFPGGGTTTYLAPYDRTVKYDKVLPNVGLSYEFVPGNTVYTSYAKGFSAPRTDNLYNVQIQNVEPETTDSIELGYRYTGSTLIATAAAWTTDFHNRIVSSFDPELGYSVDRNVGDVDLYGFDASLGFDIIENLSLYGSASYIHSEVQNDVLISPTVVLPTEGMELVETPEWTLGTRLQYKIGGATLGLQGKYVAERYATDINDESAPSYTVFDADARYDFEMFGMSSFIQLNVINVADKDYLGSVATSRFASATSPFGSVTQPPLYSVGSPRTFQVTVNASF
ncbi:iron complex outermembrane receptor protein [Povalibacter uvarum]|uniref:Iron complex outermembrane receptor protein n=1 Tax=Povalibacter uvarum TaxID=732238 RepID=A0A841HL67_9GAMM|nr:TonB-dependent receptor [Povalibacter uvarum]MBB6092968.1 iron complex outermembrane receptor protein [Povalibacter uvarum]